MIRRTKLNQANMTRLIVVKCLILLGMMGLIWRLYYLTVENRNFLVKQSNMRIVRQHSKYPLRGSLFDRNGQPLALSLQVYTAWIEPTQFEAND